MQKGAPDPRVPLAGAPLCIYLTTAYRPGQGLNRDAVERLKARREAEAAGTGLVVPGADDGEQANMLLGNGAIKKMRCGLCTRPLDEDSMSEHVTQVARASRVRRGHANIL